MKTKQKIAAALLITAVFVLGSCSKKKQAAENNGQIRLKVAHWDVSASGCIAAITEAFREENPDIPVEIIDIPSTDYTRKLQIMLNGGSGVDVFWIKDSGVTKSLYDCGQLADMSAYAGRDNIDLAVYNGLAERFVIDEKLVALPASVGYYVLYYNKSIFDRAGVPYPSNDMTWDEWESLAARVTSGNGSNKVYGGFFHTWQACVQNWALQDGKHTVMETDYSFFKPYYEMALRMQNAGIVWDYGSLKNSGIHYSSAFLQGNVAMMPMGTWFYSAIIGKINKGESNIRWGLATLPHPPQTDAGWTVGSVTPIAINRASRRKDAAWEFVKFVTGGKGAGIYAEYGLNPARADDKALITIAMSSGMPEGALEALTVKNIALDRPMADQAAEINLMLGQEHSLIMLKEVSIDKGLQNMSKRSKEIQNNN